MHPPERCWLASTSAALTLVTRFFRNIGGVLQRKIRGTRCHYAALIGQSSGAEVVLPGKPPVLRARDGRNRENIRWFTKPPAGRTNATISMRGTTDRVYGQGSKSRLMPQRPLHRAVLMSRPCVKYRQRARDAPQTGTVYLCRKYSGQARSSPSQPMPSFFAGTLR
jgi:hypothetical protein